MSQPVNLPPAFSGMAQDFPRDQMPKGKAWNLVDYIPQVLGAPLTERGGYQYASPALSTASTGTTYPKMGVVVPFSGGTQLLAIGDDGSLIKIISSTSATRVGAAVVPKQLPVFIDNLIFIPSADGSTVGKIYDGSSISVISASAPAGQFATVFIGRVWLWNTAALPARGYPSDAITSTLFDTTNSWVDVSEPVTGVASLPNVQLVFMLDHTARVRGSTPPTLANAGVGDLIVDDPIFQIGCTDARSIAVNGAMACFANDTGVYLTTGTAFPTDLTLAVGLKTYWRSLLVGYDRTTWTLSGGWFGNLYVITIMNGTNIVDTIVFDVEKTNSPAYRVSNLDAICLFPGLGTGTELYACARNSARVYKLSTMWLPSGTVKNDAGGAAVCGVWETPFFDTQNIGFQRWRDAYLEYDLTDAATDAPTITLSYLLDPSSTSYTACTPALAATTKKTTVRRPVFKKNVGMAFKVTRTNAAAQARIYEIGASMHGLEGSRRS